MAGGVFKVMVSSSFRDLRGCREAVRDAVLGQGMLPLMMEVSPAMGDRGIIENSLAMVDEADAYVVMISSHRYGQVIEDNNPSPTSVSVTELEFDRTGRRKLPVCAFLMEENVPVSPVEMRAELATLDKLLAFRSRANHHSRVTATFTTEDNLKGKAI